MGVVVNGNNVNIIMVNGSQVRHLYVNGTEIFLGPAPSEFDFVLGANDLNMRLAITESTSGAVSVDWGDGSSPSGISGGLATHTYASPGSYTVRISCADGETWLPASSEGRFDFDSTTRLISIRGGSGMQWFSAGLLAAGIAFDNQTELKSVEINSDYTGDISRTVFWGCTSLRYVRLPSGITNVSGSLNSISSSQYLTSFGEVGTGKSIELDGSATTLLPFFRNMTQLTDVTIPSAITTIAAQAFFGCTGITSLVIPENVDTILRNAFASCSNLASLTVLATTPPTVANATTITGLPAGIPIYVPAGSVDAYKAAPSWSNRAAYIQAIS